MAGRGSKWRRIVRCRVADDIGVAKKVDRDARAAIVDVAAEVCGVDERRIDNQRLGRVVSRHFKGHLIVRIQHIAPLQLSPLAAYHLIHHWLALQNFHASTTSYQVSIGFFPKTIDAHEL